MRLFSGAGLSVFDLVSDIYMITVFLGSDETRGAAYFNIACVALSLTVHLYVAWFVHRKRPLRRIARELLYVRAVTLSCAPATDSSLALAPPAGTS
jgi:hypothetical protein